MPTPRPPPKDQASGGAREDAFRTRTGHPSAKAMGFRPFPEPRGRTFLATSSLSRAWCSSAAGGRKRANFYRHSRGGRRGVRVKGRRKDKGVAILDYALGNRPST